MNGSESDPIPPHPTLRRYYADDSRRESFVREIFDKTAPFYDGVNRFFSFGSGDRYRREALKKAGLTAGMKLLDVATGTAAVARAARDVTGSTKNIVGVDLSIGMLLAARKQIGVQVAQGQTERLPVRGETFDLVSVGFALRHFADLRRTFAEYHRVLKRGGRVLILEITAPGSRMARFALGAYMGGVVPLMARIYSRDRETEKLFRYYWHTTENCVPPQTILDALAGAGFRDVRRDVELGVFSAYTGVK